MKKIGYAVLGLGIGMAHAEAAALSENADLVAVCDLREDRLAAAAAQYRGVTCYHDAAQLFTDPRVDIVSVCLPSGMHADYAVRAMEAGKHVLCEKPVDITLERATRIEEARVRTGMRCGVVLQNRFNYDMYPIREALAGGRLGKIALATFAVKWYREQRYYDAGGWRGTWEMDGGGSLINQASHTVDLMRWLLGEVATVESVTAVTGHRIGTEDVTASVLRFENGALATFASTTCAYPGISTEICLYGTEGSIEADADRLTAWKMKNPADGMDEDEEEERMLARYGAGNRTGEKKGLLFGHRHVVEDMILAVREGRDPEVTPCEAMKSLAVIRAMYESAKTGKSVVPERY